MWHWGHQERPFMFCYSKQKSKHRPRVQRLLQNSWSIKSVLRKGARTQVPVIACEYISLALKKVYLASMLDSILNQWLLPLLQEHTVCIRHYSSTEDAIRDPFKKHIQKSTCNSHAYAFQSSLHLLGRICLARVSFLENSYAHYFPAAISHCQECHVMLITHMHFVSWQHWKKRQAR